MKLLLYVLFVFLLIVPAVAESPNVVLTLVDALTKEPISDVFVEVNLEGSATNYFLEAHENLKLSVTDGDYQLHKVVIIMEKSSLRLKELMLKLYTCTLLDLLKVL
jgi:hypothetical protein